MTDAAFVKLQEKMSAYFKQLYVEEQKVLVFGEGDPRARIVMIGEAPGEQEALKGRPFVGKAGRNLDEFLQTTGFRREQLYITNVVKFRPVRRSKADRLVNRAPTAEEIKLSLPWLHKELELIRPEAIVTLGNVPLKALLGRDAVIGALHGQWQDLDGRRLYPLYHPASLIYNRSLRDVYREDIERLAREMAIENPSKEGGGSRG